MEETFRVSVCDKIPDKSTESLRPPAAADKVPEKIMHFRAANAQNVGAEKM